MSAIAAPQNKSLGAWLIDFGKLYAKLVGAALAVCLLIGLVGNQVVPSIIEHRQQAFADKLTAKVEDNTRYYTKYSASMSADERKQVQKVNAALLKTAAYINEDSKKRADKAISKVTISPFSIKPALKADKDIQAEAAWSAVYFNRLAINKIKEISGQKVEPSIQTRKSQRAA